MSMHETGLLRRAAFAAAAVMTLRTIQAPAQQQAAEKTTNQIACLPQQQPLLKVPEIISKGGKLRATIIAGTEQQRMGTRYPTRINGRPSQPGDPQTYEACYPEFVRVFRSPDAIPPYPGPTKGFADPMSGPTLRAGVGEVIELSFINQIDPSKFGLSIDLGDNADCDSTGAGYPGNDTYPNCFHGSTTANIHFHGTHTNPGSTGDNVFLEIVSSRRLTGQPVATEAMVRPAFDRIFKKCEAELAKGSHVEWPVTWSDLPRDVLNPPPGTFPNSWVEKQRQLLQKFDTLPKIGRKLWPVDEAQNRKGQWPQYYIGTYPYCFKLPKYPEVTPAPVPKGGEGEAELHAHEGATAPSVMQQGGALKMGQAPGTHWYHAHKHGSTTVDEANGLSGAFIIEGTYDDQINDYYKDFGEKWARTQPVLVINQFGTVPNLKAPGAGQDKGPEFSVNGRINPVLKMKPGEVQMWRIVNTSGRAGAFFIGPPAGFTWRQLAQDGVQFHNDNYATSLNKSFLLAPGNRADLLVQAPSTPCPTASGCLSPVEVHNIVDPGDLIPATPPSRGPFNISLLTLQVTNDAPVKMTLPATTPAATFPAFLENIQTSEVSGTKRIDFGTVPQTAPPKVNAIHTIDGQQFSGEVGAVVLLNKVEEWTVTNNSTGISHPFHIHINPFQITEVFAPNARLGTITGSGSVTTTAGSAVVAGSGTSFKTQFRARDAITIANEPLTTVKSIESDTSLTLNAPAATSGSGRPYTYDALQYIVSTDDNAPVVTGQCRLNPDKPETWKPCAAGATPAHRIWWDVFPIPSGVAVTDSKGANITIPGYFKMRSRFVDYPGYFVIHCHILAHEDRGMMTVVEIAPLRSPYSHH